MIRFYNIIYEALEYVEKSLSGLLEPDIKEIILGSAEIKKIFKVSNAGKIAGSKVTEGVIKRNLQARLFREEELIVDGKINSLKRFKDDIKEVKEGLECGIGIEGVKKYKEGDIIEAYEIEEIKRTLD